jgi:hypothetical protein
MNLLLGKGLRRRYNLSREHCDGALVRLVRQDEVRLRSRAALPAARACALGMVCAPVCVKTNGLFQTFGRVIWAVLSLGREKLSENRPIGGGAICEKGLTTKQHIDHEGHT